MPEQVKKGAPTGQFLPKGSFVIEGKRNYLKGVELRLAIGIMQLNNKRETLLCGPEEAIKKRSLFYAVLLQGGLDPMNAPKKIKSEFVKIAEGNIKIAESIKHISLDDFIRALPAGQCRLSFTARGQQQLPRGTTTISDRRIRRQTIGETITSKSVKRNGYGRVVRSESISKDCENFLTMK